MARQRHLRTIVCWLLLSAVAPAQSFLFVSPNTRSHMSDELAWESQDSFEQRNFLTVASRLAARLCSRPEVLSAEGMDGSTSENSSLITGCKNGEARYLGELLGRYAHQKWILVFDPASAGKEQLLIVGFSSEHPADVVRQMRQYGLTAGTVVAREKLVRVYVWVKDNSQSANVRAFVQANQGTLQELSGRGVLIGDGSRSRAQTIFDKGIQDYERKHHRSLSRLLWSRQFHDLGMTGSQ